MRPHFMGWIFHKVATAFERIAGVSPIETTMPPLWSIGVNPCKMGRMPYVCTPVNSKLARGGWDRSRTCTLRFWSLLPFVQQRSGTYTNGLEIANFDSPKYVDVHRRWGHNWVNSEQSGALFPWGYLRVRRQVEHTFVLALARPAIEQRRCATARHQRRLYLPCHDHILDRLTCSWMDS
jgi:hypothetical protein